MYFKGKSTLPPPREWKTWNVQLPQQVMSFSVHILTLRQYLANLHHLSCDVSLTYYLLEFFLSIFQQFLLIPKIIYFFVYIMIMFFSIHCFSDMTNVFQCLIFIIFTIFGPFNLAIIFLFAYVIVYTDIFTCVLTMYLPICVVTIEINLVSSFSQVFFQVFFSFILF